MLKILEPFWKRASLGHHAAPLKNGSRISQIPANGIHRDDHHWTHWLLDIGAIFTREVFPFVAVGEKIWVVDSRQKSPRCSLGGGGWCTHHFTGGKGGNTTEGVLKKRFWRDSIFSCNRRCWRSLFPFWGNKCPSVSLFNKQAPQIENKLCFA